MEISQNYMKGILAFALVAVLLVSGCSQGPAIGGTTATPKSVEEVSKVVTDVGKDVQGISDILSEVDAGLSGKIVGK